MTRSPVTEREMENLIAEFPSDFFPRRKLVFRGRQESFGEAGRFDLLFQDEFQTNILMELKARPAKYEDANQLARYGDELVRRGERNVLMWLVAPQIPNSVKDFLERFGIEYSEIHTVEFRRVAERHNVTVAEDERSGIPEAPQVTIRPAPVRHSQPPSRVSDAQVETGPVVTALSPLRWNRSGYDLALVNRDAFDAHKFAALIDAFDEAVPSRKNSSLVADLRRWVADPGQHWPHEACRRLLRWVITGTTWKRAVPAAEAVWGYLFGRPIPTWSTWNSGEKRYEFDQSAWQVWFESLPH